MAGNLLDRVFNMLSLLAGNAAGLPLQRIADGLAIPKSAAHRILSDLIRLGFVRQDPFTSHYLLTTKLLSVGFAYLASSGVADIAQPVLDGLAKESGELVRLAIVDDRTLTWVAKSQGARAGLRYDPEMGGHPALLCTATGQCWLATLSDDEVQEIVAREGFGRPDEHGPHAPRTLSELRRRLNRARTEGFAIVVESAAPGASAIACVIPSPSTGRAVGTISIAGPAFRLTEARMRQLAPRLIAAAAELANASIGSEFFASGQRPAAGKS